MNGTDNLESIQLVIYIYICIYMYIYMYVYMYRYICVCDILVPHESGMLQNSTMAFACWRRITFSGYVRLQAYIENSTLFKPSNYIIFTHLSIKRMPMV